MECLNNIYISHACCDNKNPQTPSCRSLVEEAKKFIEEMQLKAALLPEELKTEFETIMNGKKI